MSDEAVAPRTPDAEWSRAAEAGLSFRPVVEADLPFLRLLYGSTRAEEIAAVPWSYAEKAAFLDMQFRAQHSHYRQHHPGADRLVAMSGGQDIGRLYLERRSDPYRIIDIALLPAHRGKGLGAALLRDLIDEAAAAGKALSIHVEKFNPAMRLYRRLGFTKIEDHGLYDLMRWAPQPNIAS